MDMSSNDQVAVRCVLMRGGTSKAMFFHEADVPAAGPARDRFLMRAMGTPDVLQRAGGNFPGAGLRPTPARQQ